MFSSRSFIVLDLTIRSLIHFELVNGIKQGSNFIFFCSGFPIFPTLFAEGAVFSPLCGLGTFVKDHLTTFSKVFICSLFSVSLIYRPIGLFLCWYHTVLITTDLYMFWTRKCDVFILFSSLFSWFRVLWDSMWTLGFFPPISAKIPKGLHGLCRLLWVVWAF